MTKQKNEVKGKYTCLTTNEIRRIYLQLHSVQDTTKYYRPYDADNHSSGTSCQLI